MSKERFAEILKDERSGGEAAPAGLSLSKILTEVGVELKQQAAHGAHELATALFSPSGNGFVMYPRTAGNEGVDQAPAHGLSQEVGHQPEIEQERGGREI